MRRLIALLALLSVGFGASAQNYNPGYAPFFQPGFQFKLATAMGPVFQTDFTQGTLNPAIGLARASTGSYFNSSGVSSIAAVNAARFDFDPNALSAKGLLSEGQRTNSALQSAFSTGWSAQFATLTVNSAPAPDGTNSAALFNDGSTSNYHELYRSATFSTSATVATSVYVKAGTGRYFTLSDATSSNQGGYACFDLTTGTVTQSGNLGTGVLNAALSTATGNGWYRLTVVITPPSGGTILYGGIFSSSATPTYSPDILGRSTYTGSGNTYYVWGAQGEAGSFPTSYIPTTTAAVTRSADVLSTNAPLTGYLAAGPSVIEIQDEATGVISRTAFAAGAFTFPQNAWLRSMAVYPSGTNVSGKLTPGTPY